MTRNSTSQPQLVLASASPRRQQLLEMAGFGDIDVVRPHVDDGLLRKPDCLLPEYWIMALAWLKARSVAQLLSGRTSSALILAADTVCVQSDGSVLGQPSDEVAARQMLSQLRNATHRTMTGVCLLPLDVNDPQQHRNLFFDVTKVRVGDISNAMIDSYVASGAWRGKAGAYNLQERLDDHWPIEIVGDPTTVMGLPMNMLRGFLRPVER